MDNSWILAELRWRQGFERELMLCCFLSFTHTRTHTHIRIHTHTHTPPHAHGGGVEVPASYLKMGRISVILSGEHDTRPVQLADPGD